MSEHTTVHAALLDHDDPELGVPRPMVCVSAVSGARQFLTEIYSPDEYDRHFIRVRVDPAHDHESSIAVVCTKEQLDALILSLVRARSIAARAGVLP